MHDGDPATSGSTSQDVSSGGLSATADRDAYVAGHDLTNHVTHNHYYGSVVSGAVPPRARGARRIDTRPTDGTAPSTAVSSAPDSLALRIHQLTRALDSLSPSFATSAEPAGVPSQDLLRSRQLAAKTAEIILRKDNVDSGSVLFEYNDRFDGFNAFALAGKQGQPVVYLFQATWSPDGCTGIEPTVAAELPIGLVELLGHELDQLPPLPGHLENLRRKAGAAKARLVLVWSTSVQESASPDVIQAIDHQLAWNGWESRVEKRFLALPDFIASLEADVARTGVDLTGALLKNPWAIHRRLDSLQGTVSAAELGRWYTDHPDHLFDDNVRRPIADSDINEEIIRCLRDEPELFWYRNIGVTALCEDWDDQSAEMTSEVQFDFTGLRIVNGAQTVSSIKAVMDDSPAQVGRAVVPIRIIRLKGHDPEFGARIAYATNRSNPLEPRDRLAMDHVQQRLRTQFRLTWGHDYVIRAADPLPDPGNGCSVVEATRAMAAGRFDGGHLAEATVRLSDLWPGDGKLYQLIFSDDTSAVEVWRRVQVLRLVTSALESVPVTARELVIAKLGELAVVSLVSRCLGDDGIADITSDWDERLARVPEFACRTLKALVPVANAKVAGMSEPVAAIARQFENGKWLASELPKLSAVIKDSQEPVEPAAPDAPRWTRDPWFFLEIRGTDKRAKGVRCDKDGFLVLAGSPAAAVENLSVYAPQLRSRHNLIDSLDLVPCPGDADHLTLRRDILFTSPSQALTVLRGVAENGRMHWKTEDGQTYAEVFPKKRR